MISVTAGSPSRGSRASRPDVRARIRFTRSSRTAAPARGCSSLARRATSSLVVSSRRSRRWQAARAPTRSVLRDHGGMPQLPLEAARQPAGQQSRVDRAGNLRVTLTATFTGTPRTSSTSGSQQRSAFFGNEHHASRPDRRMEPLVGGPENTVAGRARNVQRWPRAAATSSVRPNGTSVPTHPPSTTTKRGSVASNAANAEVTARRACDMRLSTWQQCQAGVDRELDASESVAITVAGTTLAALLAADPRGRRRRGLGRHRRALGRTELVGALAANAEHSLLVLRPCFLALRTALSARADPADRRGARNGRRPRAVGCGRRRRSRRAREGRGDRRSGRSAPDFWPVGCRAVRCRLQLGALIESARAACQRRCRHRNDERRGCSITREEHPLAGWASSTTS